MLSANLAIVHKVLPEKHGVLVTFRDGTSYMNDENTGRFVRVLASRAHPTMGSAVSLPQPGELGVVLDIDEEVSVWIGSLHWLLENQAEPTEWLTAQHFDSGVTVQTRDNGDFQIDHPSGLVVRVSEEDADLPVIENTSAPEDVPCMSPYVVIRHPSDNATISISPDGLLTIQAFSKMVVQINGDIDASLTGNLSVTCDGDTSVTTSGNTEVTTTGTTTITSTGDATVTTSGNATVHADGNLTGSAGGSLTLTGSPIKLN